MGDTGDPTQEPGTDRVEALSDGLFAVAMTLLIFDFHVPALPRTASNLEVTPALLGLWPKFITYAVSFLSLGVYWIGHHNMYQAVRRADRVLLGLNIVVFMFVALLPFSTSVLNAFMETQAGLLFFGANLTIIGWLFFLQWVYVSSRPGMLFPFVTPTHRATVRLRFLAYPVVVTLTMLLCFWSVPISLAIYLLMLPAYLIPGTPFAETAAHRSHKRRKAVAAPPVEPAPSPGAERAVAGPSPKRGVNKRVVVPVVGVVVALISWAAFRPELLFVNRRVAEAFPAHAASAGLSKPLLTGRFHGVAHATHGVAAVYRLPDGSRLLRLTDFTTSNGPDVRVYLIAAPDATDNNTVTRRGFVEVARLKANQGDQNYPLPAGLDISGYHAVTIWCDRFHVNFATAPLAAY